jgi:hypothetical protein
MTTKNNWKTYVLFIIFFPVFIGGLIFNTLGALWAMLDNKARTGEWR